MLNEAPKKKKQESGPPSKARLFWRIQRECWRRMITPFMMYLFTSLLAYAVAALAGVDNLTVKIVADVVCIAFGAVFNAHLAYNYGKMHYDAYLTGCLHRKNELFGIQSGGDHRTEREFRVWKGFYIGFLVGVPVILFGGLGHVSGFFRLLALLFTSWAVAPMSWVQLSRQKVLGETYVVSSLWSLPMALLPVLVTGVSYLVGAYICKRNRELGKPNTAEEKKRAKGRK